MTEWAGGWAYRLCVFEMLEGWPEPEADEPS
jgi:hypothetical protein